jgi:hypothetical protein
VEPTSPPQPAVIAADFTALYDRCLASGLKARVVFSHWALNVDSFLQLPSASRDLCRSWEAPPLSSPLSKAQQSRHHCAGCSGSGYTRFTLYHNPTRCFAATGNTNAVA